MPYQRAISTLGCAEMNLSKVFALAALHGLDAIEIRALQGTLDLPVHLERHYGTPSALAQRIRSAGGRIAAFSTSLQLAGHTTADREKFLEFIPWAEALGVRWLRVFDGNCRADTPGAAEAIATMHWWQDLRRQCGWRVDCMVETHDALFDSTQINRFMSAVPFASILWDSHHTWKRCGEDPVATWRAIGPHVVHVHVKDSISQPSEHHPFTYVLPGVGEFPMAPLVRILRREFAGTMSLEWERLWHPYLPPLETALQAATAAAWW